mgnify:CR=1 FL=1
MSPRKALRFSPVTIPLAFAALVVLAYGLLVTRTGFYWDDWPFAWGAHFAGPESFLRSFLRVRPFLGPIFYLTTSLLPETPLAWQLFALVIRFLLTLAAWWALASIWPERPRQTLAAALVFLVYPGYSQHWVAFTHINQELIPLLFYILSFGATGWAFHQPDRFRSRTLIALLLLLLGVFPTEYFVTLEPLRFLFIFAMLKDVPLIPRAWQTFKRWLPYLFVWLLNAAWLFFYYRSGVYANYDLEVVQDVQASASGALSGFIAAAAEAVFKAGLVAYAQILALVTESFPSPTAILTLALIVLTFAALTFYLSRLSTFTESAPPSVPIRESVTKSVPQSAPLRESVSKSVPQSVSFRESVTKSVAASVPASVSFRESVIESVDRFVDFLLIGLLGILLGRIPSWAAGLPLTLQSSFDRFNVSLMLAASLFIVGLLELFLRSQRQKLVVLSLLVALGVGQQFYNANIFRRDWQRQRELYWQLTWRAPAIAPGTVLFTDTVEIDYETDYSLTAPVNWLYAPNLNTLELPYLVFGVDMRPNRLELDSNTPIEFAYRPAHFSGNTSQSIAFLAPKNGCLRLLAPGDEIGYQNLSARMQQAIALSDLGRIQAASVAESVSTRVSATESAAESASPRDFATESVAESASTRDSATESAAESASIRESATESVAKSASIRVSATESVAESASIRESATESVAESALIRDSATESVAESASIRESVTESVAESVFGPAPALDWCYFYVHADLARQYFAWDEVARLDRQAVEIGLMPSDPLEWLPFVEAGASLGQVDLAAERTRQVVAARPFLRKAFCAAWLRAEQRQSLPPGLLADLGCQ